MPLSENREHTTPGHTTPGCTTPENTTLGHTTPGYTTPGLTDCVTMEITPRAGVDRTEAAKYLLDRQIPELFQALTAGLVHNRPTDPVQFIVNCLDHAREVGAENVFWDTFLAGNPATPADIHEDGASARRAHSRMSLPPLVGDSRRGSSATSTSEMLMAVQKESGGEELPANVVTKDVEAPSRRSDKETASMSKDKSLMPKPATEDSDVHPSWAMTTASDVDDVDVPQADSTTVVGSDEVTLDVPGDELPQLEIDENDLANDKTPHNQKTKAKISREEQKRLKKAKKARPTGRLHGKFEPKEPVEGLDDDQEAEMDEDELSRQISEPPQHGLKFLSRPRVMDILQGSLEDLPLIPSNTVRIFLSSTFTDFKAERNVLPRLAYPKLRSFCGERGLDFQVVDMRWGVTDEMMNDHKVSELCLREIKTCQQVSCGPSFVAMLGNKYGYRPFPTKINATELGLLLSVGEAHDLEDKALLLDWYKIDTNAVPGEYVLQPIASKLKHYNDTSPENEDKRSEDRNAWSSISNKLLMVLRTLAQLALDENKFTPDDTDKYFISVTEEEIRAGLLELEDTRGKVLCFERRLQGIEKHDNTPKRWRFIDLIDKENIDEDAEKFRTALVESKVPIKISQAEQMKRYQLKWKGVPLEEAEDAEEEYRAYLENFASDFVSKMVEMITSESSVSSDSSEQIYRELYHEVLHHARFSIRKCEIFCGREETMSLIQQYFREETKEHAPLVISGQSGFGKTAVLAYAAKSVQSWLKDEEHHTILRFLGTSPQSSNVIVLLRSVIYQICALYGWSPPGEDHFSKIGTTRRYFWGILERVGVQYPHTKLFLILDSVDQLSQSYAAHKISWLPKMLPGNVFVVLSVLSDRYNCLESAYKRFGQECCHELPTLSATNGDEIIQAYLSAHSRTLTREQHNFVLTTFKKVSQPLFLKLVLDETLKWYSYDPVDEVSLADSARGAIAALFENMETVYGKMFLSRALGYLTCGYVGLSSLEMEDVLSCDDDVLNEVYKYHDPPMEGTIRIPSLLWARIQDELHEYLAHRQVDGKAVMTWYHRQFWEAAERRYLEGGDQRATSHKLLAELYDQADGIKRTIVLKQRGMKTMENADRRVSPQVLKISNVRKLTCLPYHLLLAGKIDRLLGTCLINFDFLYTKLQAVGISSLLNGYMDDTLYRGLRSNEEFVLMCDFLDISYDSLRFDTALLAYNVVDRLGKLENNGPLCTRLISHAKEWMAKSDTPLLLPTHPMNVLGLDSALKFSVMVGFDGVMTPNEKTLVCSRMEQAQNLHSVSALDIATKDIRSTVSVPKLTPLAVTPDSSSFIIMEGHYIQLRDVETDDLIKKVRYTKKTYSVITPRCMTVSNNGKYVAVGVKLGKEVGTSEEEAWKLNSYIAVMDITTSEESAMYENTFRCRKHIETLIFIDDDSKLLAIGSPKICQYSVPDLELLVTFDGLQGIYGHIPSYIPERNTLAVSTSHSQGVKAALYNCNDNICISSKAMMMDDDREQKLFAFACHVKPDLSEVVVGAAVHENTVRKSHLFFWDTKENKVRSHILCSDQWKTPSTMQINKAWDTAYIGFRTGNLMLYDLKDCTSVLMIPAHGGYVNYLKIYDNGKFLVTLAQDHFLKVWDVQRLHNQAKSAKESLPIESQTQVPEDGDEIPKGSLMLDPDEQCLDVITTNTHAITAPVWNTQSPKWWKLEDGTLDTSITVPEYRKYIETLEANELEFAGRTHGSVTMCDDKMLYFRKKRNVLLLYISHKGGDGTLKEFKDTFFCLLPATNLLESAKQTVKDRIIMLVKDGSLETLNTNFDVLSSIEVPKITDIVNIESNTGKRRLIYYKVAVTLDKKYFLIVNPAAGKKLKFLDLVDLESQTYVGRIPMDLRTNWKVLEESFYYLVWREDAKDCELLPPSKIATSLIAFKYKCLLYTSVNLLSSDLTLGLEFVRSNGIRIWRTEPLEKLHTLYGHESDLSKCTFSRDNRFVASGSRDHTVRMWSVVSGQQLCVFHVYGAVDNVMFTDDIKHIVVHCYSAPQRKRAVVLKIHNVDNTHCSS